MNRNGRNNKTITKKNANNNKNVKKRQEETEYTYGEQK